MITIGLILLGLVAAAFPIWGPYVVSLDDEDRDQR